MSSNSSGMNLSGFAFFFRQTNTNVKTNTITAPAMLPNITDITTRRRVKKCKSHQAYFPVSRNINLHVNMYILEGKPNNSVNAKQLIFKQCLI